VNLHLLNRYFWFNYVLSTAYTPPEECSRNKWAFRVGKIPHFAVYSTFVDYIHPSATIKNGQQKEIKWMVLHGNFGDMILKYHLILVPTSFRYIGQVVKYAVCNSESISAYRLNADGKKIALLGGEQRQIKSPKEEYPETNFRICLFSYIRILLSS